MIFFSNFAQMISMFALADKILFAKVASITWSALAFKQMHSTLR